MFKKLNKKILTEKKIGIALSILILISLIPIVIKGQQTVNNILDYFLNTDGNNMSSGEYFRVEDLGGNEFRICKSHDCVGYQRYRYDSNYIYFMEDTTWATGLNQPISCLNTGNYAFYRVYNGYGANCDNLGNYSLGGPWAPRTMSVGQTFTSEHSIVAFDSVTNQCCRGQYAGDFGYHVTLTYEGCIRFPTGVTSPHGIVLSTGSENFYFDSNRGWVGWDQGTSGSGSYTTDDLGTVGEGEDCLDVESALVLGPGGQQFIVTMEWPPDPATFYIAERGNTDLIDAISNLVASAPGFRPPPGWEGPINPTPAPPPENPDAILNILGYFQYDDLWKDIELDSCNPPITMERYGCGPTSIAMIIRFLYPELQTSSTTQISPGIIGENIDTPIVICGVGTAYIPIVNWLINERGYYDDLNYANIGFNIDAIAESTNNGRPVVVYCRAWGPSGWNHISVIRGVDTVDGNRFVYFQDPVLGDVAYEDNLVVNEFGCDAATSFWR